MMKHIIFTSALVLASAVTGEAMAVCPAGEVTGLSTLLAGNTICQGVGLSKQAQEEHFGTGLIASALKDYKKGPSDPADPEIPVGTWLLTGDGSASATVTYNYTAFVPSASYTYKVYLVSGTLNTDGSTYDFCDTATGTVTVPGATLKTGVVGPLCP
jgi:hypothetical protein